MTFFNTEADQSELTKKFFDLKRYGDLEAIEQCTNMSKVDQVKNCFKFCNDFNFLAFSNFFDGNVKFLDIAFNNTVNVLRNQGFIFKDNNQVEKGPESYNSNISIYRLKFLSNRKSADSYSLHKNRKREFRNFRKLRGIKDFNWNLIN